MARWRPGLTQKAKHPDGIRCYTANFIAFLGSDTIASHTSVGTNVTIDSSTESGKVITITVSGGTHNNTGKVVVTMTSSSSPAKVEVVTFFIPIDDQRG